MRRAPPLISAAVLAAVALVPVLQGCATNPATGRTTFTGGMTTADEVRIGRESHPRIVKEFGGVYGSPERGPPGLGRYVSGIGRLLVQTVERRDISYTFTVLNSDIVNAFAVPGGYVYITRGLLALADDEAQLAGVLAHELGHLTALHHAERYGQSLLANIFLSGVGIITGQVAPGGGRAIMRAGQTGALTLLRGFSRGNELEADDLGLRYMSRAGFDPAAMAGFLEKLRAHSRLGAKLRGESPDKIDRFDYLATHPAPIQRLSRARQKAAAMAVSQPITARQIYLAKIDGILYGDDPKQGVIRGREFAHPELRIRFEAPEGFRLFNSRRSVIGFGPNGARIVFDRAQKPVPGPMSAYLTRTWAPGLSNVETIDIHGLEAATGTKRVNAKRGALDLRLLAIREGPRKIYRFMFITPADLTASLSPGLRRATYSFRRLSEDEARAIRPRKLRIVTVGRGDTQETLAARMPFAEFRLERFRVLNGLDARDRLRPGQKVKIVTE